MNMQNTNEQAQLSAVDLYNLAEQAKTLANEANTLTQTLDWKTLGKHTLALGTALSGFSNRMKANAETLELKTGAKLPYPLQVENEQLAGAITRYQKTAGKVELPQSARDLIAKASVLAQHEVSSLEAAEVILTNMADTAAQPVIKTETVAAPEPELVLTADMRAPESAQVIDMDLFERDLNAAVADMRNGDNGYNGNFRTVSDVPALKTTLVSNQDAVELVRSDMLAHDTTALTLLSALQHESFEAESLAQKLNDALDIAERMPDLTGLDAMTAADTLKASMRDLAGVYAQILAETNNVLKAERKIGPNKLPLYTTADGRNYEFTLEDEKTAHSLRQQLETLVADFDNLKTDVYFDQDAVQSTRNYLTFSLQESALDKQAADNTYTPDYEGIEAALEKLSLTRPQMAFLATAFTAIGKYPDEEARTAMSIATLDAVIAQANGDVTDISSDEKATINAFDVDQDVVDYLHANKDALTLPRLLAIGEKVYGHDALMPGAHNLAPQIPAQKTPSFAQSAAQDPATRPAIDFDFSAPAPTTAEKIAALVPPVDQNAWSPLHEQIAPQNLIDAQDDFLSSIGNFREHAAVMISHMKDTKKADAFAQKLQANPLGEIDADGFKDPAEFTRQRILAQRIVEENYEPLADEGAKRGRRAKSATAHIWNNVPDSYDAVSSSLYTFLQQHAMAVPAFTAQVNALLPGLEAALLSSSKDELKPAYAKELVSAVAGQIYGHPQAALIVTALQKAAEADAHVAGAKNEREVNRLLAGLPDLKQAYSEREQLLRNADFVLFYDSEKPNAKKRASYLEREYAVYGRLANLGAALTPVAALAVVSELPTAALATPSLLQRVSATIGGLFTPAPKPEKTRVQPLFLDGDENLSAVSVDERSEPGFEDTAPLTVLEPGDRREPFMPEVESLGGTFPTIGNIRPGAPDSDITDVEPRDITPVSALDLDLGPIRPLGNLHAEPQGEPRPLINVIAPEQSPFAEQDPILTADEDFRLDPRTPRAPTVGDKINEKIIAASVFGKGAWAALGEKVDTAKASSKDALGKGAVFARAAGAQLRKRGAVMAVGSAMSLTVRYGTGIAFATALSAGVGFLSAPLIAAGAILAGGLTIVGGVYAGAGVARLNSAFDQITASGEEKGFKAAISALQLTLIETGNGDLIRQSRESVGGLPSLLAQAYRNVRENDAALENKTRTGNALRALATPFRVLGEAGRIDPTKLRMGMSTLFGAVGAGAGFIFGHLHTVRDLGLSPNAPAHVTTPVTPAHVDTPALPDNTPVITADPVVTNPNPGTAVQPGAAGDQTAVAPVVTPENTTQNPGVIVEQRPNLQQTTPQVVQVPAVPEAIAAATTDAGRVRALMDLPEMKEALAKLNPAQQRHFGTLIQNATTRGSFTSLNDLIDNISEGGRMNGNTFTRIPGLRPDRATAIELRTLIQRSLAGVDFDKTGYDRALALNNDHLAAMQGRPSRVGEWVANNPRPRAEITPVQNPSGTNAAGDLTRRLNSAAVTGGVGTGYTPEAQASMDKLVEQVRNQPEATVVVTGGEQPAANPGTNTFSGDLERAAQGARDRISNGVRDLTNNVKNLFGGASANEGVTGNTAPIQPITVTELPPIAPVYTQPWLNDFRVKLHNQFVAATGATSNGSSGMTEQAFNDMLKGVDSGNRHATEQLRSWSGSLLKHSQNLTDEQRTLLSRAQRWMAPNTGRRLTI